VSPSPELDLLLCCARRTAGAGTAARMDGLLRAGFDGPALLRGAERHRLVPLLHRHLRPHASHLSTDLAAELKARAASAAAEGLRKAAELHRLLAWLRDAGVTALAYKGPALAVEAYGDVGLRTLSDLDLLVAPADVPRALEVLAERGYVPAHPLTPAREAAFRRTDGDYPLVHGETGALVEMHAHLSSMRFGVALPTEQVIARRRSVRVGGADVPVPAADDLLLALALHGAKHRWSRLEWTASFAEMVRAHPAAAVVALARAPGLGMQRVLVLAFALAERALGTPLPLHASAAVAADPTSGALAAELLARMEPDAAEAGEVEADDAAGNLLFNLRLRDGLRGRGEYAWRWATHSTPEDWAALPLPDALFPLYRATRPVRLLARYGPRVLRGRKKG
jgi:hypothetical protein